MKDLSTGIITMTLLTATSVAADIEVQYVAEIKTIVESVAVLADSGDFEALESLYAEEVLVDYSSLTGVEAELKSPQALMNEWASVLPGFDTTRHEVSDIAVTVSNSHAIATADVVADHYVSGLYWQVTGSYRYEFVHRDDGWRITAATFELHDESGSREVFGAAADKAAASPPAYIVRQQTADAVLTLLTSLEEKDMARFASIWADDAVQDMPYSPSGHPRRVVGKDELVKLYAGWPENSGEADFTSELVFYPMQDPETIFVEFKGNVDIIPTGRQYRQSYGGLFHVVNGKIELFREYYDPAAFAWAFGLDEN